MGVPERVKSVFLTLWEEFGFVALCFWFGVKTALTFGVPLFIGWFSIPFFQRAGLLLQGTNIEFLLIIVMVFIATIGASSVGAVLYWALWGINPFKGVETKQHEQPFSVQAYLETTWTAFIKYFLHGIFFSVLFLLLGLTWVFIFASLIVLGSFIGFVIGIGILFLLVGVINSVLGVYLWNIDAGGKGLLGIFFHGLTLFIILSIIQSTASYLFNHVFPGTASLLVTFIISTFLYGVIGRIVCLLFGKMRE